MSKDNMAVISGKNYRPMASVKIRIESNGKYKDIELNSVFDRSIGLKVAGHTIAKSILQDAKSITISDYKEY